MKTVLLIILSALLTGCMSQEAVLELIDEQIAANNSQYIQPALAQQTADTAALAVKVADNSRAVDKNRKAIVESGAQVSVHQDVLLDLFQKQQEAAASALDLLTPQPDPAQESPAPALSPVAAPAPEAMTAD